MAKVCRLAASPTSDGHKFAHLPPTSQTNDDEAYFRSSRAPSKHARGMFFTRPTAVPISSTVHSNTILSRLHTNQLKVESEYRMSQAEHYTHLLSFTLLEADEAIPFDSASANSAIPGFSTRVAIIT